MKSDKWYQKQVTELRKQKDELLKKIKSNREISELSLEEVKKYWISRYIETKAYIEKLEYHITNNMKY